MRGLSTLLILEKIMEEIQKLEVASNRRRYNDALPRPCDYFELAGGTSTGG